MHVQHRASGLHRRTLPRARPAHRDRRPIASSISAKELRADHVVIGEAEELIATLARDLEMGQARQLYEATERPAMNISPLPDSASSR